MRRNYIFPDLKMLEVLVDRLVATRHVSRAVEVLEYPLILIHVTQQLVIHVVVKSCKEEFNSDASQAD